MHGDVTYKAVIIAAPHRTATPESPSDTVGIGSPVYSVANGFEASGAQRGAHGRLSRYAASPRGSPG